MLGKRRADMHRRRLGHPVACVAPKPNCSNGACVCHNGDTQCSGNGVQTCSGGVWGNPVGCSAPKPSCSNGACVCTNGALGCSGNTVQKCTAGNWEHQFDCEGDTPNCSGGKCLCTNGKFKCTGTSTRQTCSGGNWQAASACNNPNEPVCFGEGTCVCNPGTNGSRATPRSLLAATITRSSRPPATRRLRRAPAARVPAPVRSPGSRVRPHRLRERRAVLLGRNL